jgi:type IV pilus assembly protein PilB
MLDEKLFETIITKAKFLSVDALAKHKKDAEKRNEPLEKYLIEKELISENNIYKKAATHFGLPFIDLKQCTIKKEIIKMVPATVAEKHSIMAFDKKSDVLYVATLEPNDLQTVDFLKKKTALKIRVFLASPEGFRECMHRFYAGWSEAKKIEGLTVLQEQAEGGYVSQEDLEKAAQDLPIVNIVNTIVEQAVYSDASDIHIEPAEKQLRVRYRIDGVLGSAMTLPKAVQAGVLARVKVLAKLRLDEHMLPQDGRFKMKIHDDNLAFRVSIVPLMYGEKIVMRILREGAKPLSLEELGLHENPRNIVESNIKKPHGLILVTGPTGSGKTTTLYSLLALINKPSVNILTIEDPVEYNIRGVSQSQVNNKAGFGFVNALRSFLRQDPDVMMVGEIRDEETAEIALHAAMTGHLVLSTLHTNDAPTSLPRLADMNVPNFLVSFTVNMIIAQRLVRKLCMHCRKEYKIDATQARELEKMFDTKEMLVLYRRLGLLKKGEKTLKSNIFYKHVGCEKCGNTGYRGRIGVYEVLEISEEIREAINRKANADELRVLARKQGMMTIAEDGLIKAKMGTTSLEEILRVMKD